jgi:hypothetical protein
MDGQGVRTSSGSSDIREWAGLQYVVRLYRCWCSHKTSGTGKVLTSATSAGGKQASKLTASPAARVPSLPAHRLLEHLRAGPRLRQDLLPCGIGRRHEPHLRSRQAQERHSWISCHRA